MKRYTTNTVKPLSVWQERWFT